ncbi:MAG: hypothetical protein PGN22_15540 [Agrobacterium cavarae]
MQSNHIEKLEVLDGSRSGSRERAAVRLEDVRDLLQLAQVKTKEVAAAPTPDDFNSLLKDIKEISNRLNAVAQALQRKIIR